MLLKEFNSSKTTEASTAEKEQSSAGNGNGTSTGGWGHASVEASAEPKEGSGADETTGKSSGGIYSGLVMRCEVELSRLSLDITEPSDAWEMHSEKGGIVGHGAHAAAHSGRELSTSTNAVHYGGIGGVDGMMANAMPQTLFSVVLYGMHFCYDAQHQWSHGAAGEALTAENVAAEEQSLVAIRVGCVRAYGGADRMELLACGKDPNEWLLDTTVLNHNCPGYSAPQVCIPPRRRPHNPRFSDPWSLMKVLSMHCLHSMGKIQLALHNRQ